MTIDIKQYSPNSTSGSENRIPVKLTSEKRLISSDTAASTIDEYMQYMKEKDGSNIYRLIFTIDPVCSNVLFNSVTELVYKEGSGDAKFIGGISGGTYVTPSSVNCADYARYKGLSQIGRADLLKDTGFSHPDMGPITYHCGYDIFNNHLLRKKEFHVVTKKNYDDEGKSSVFNTLSDYMRTYEGNIVEETKAHVEGEGEDSRLVSGTTEAHAYLFDTVLSYQKSISENLTEKDGWFGFSNPCNIKVSNFIHDDGSETCINKCMNGNKSGEFIDLYPDRSLYSFIPKFNKYRNRIEKNWDYCLTYPYGSMSNHTLVTDPLSKSNGIEFTFNGILFDSDGREMLDEGSLITFRTSIRHTFREGDRIGMDIVLGSANYGVDTGTIVESVGLNGYDYDHYFTIRYSDISGIVSYINKTYHTGNTLKGRVRKYRNGKECKYYIRLFRRIPNFRNSDVYNKRYLEESEIAKYSKVDFSSTVGKMAFEDSIYGDRKSQIVFSDDIDLSCLKDNLGRQLSTIYLTIVKRNKGYDKWYKSGGPSMSDDVEFSHCFGKVTAGFDLPDYADDYNVHKIHNLTRMPTLTNCILKVPESPKSLESDNGGEISVNGDTSLGDGIFYGDIVEFSEYAFDEMVVEDVQFRFNTAQREYEVFNFSESDGNEYVSGEYSDILFDEIINDDFDIEGLFTAISKKYNRIEYHKIDGDLDSVHEYPVNINPEGYYYKPHYPIAVRSLKDNSEQGSHIRITIASTITPSGSTIRINTAQNYHIEVGDTLYLYKKSKTSERLTGIATEVTGPNYNIITFNVYEGENVYITRKEGGSITVSGGTPKSIYIDDYFLYRKNPLMPDFAYDMADGSGRYIWRDVKKESEMTYDDRLYNSMFTNGAHYRHSNIQFYLKRQDPYGNFGLTNTNGMPTKIASTIIDGEKMAISDKQYVPEEDSTC